MKLNSTLRTVLGLACAALFAVSSPASAQAFPTKPVRIVTTYPTGASADISMRIVAEELQRMWGQPVIVESRPGGNGLVAIRGMRNWATDGHELLLLGTGLLTITPHMTKKPEYDTFKDFAPVSPLWRAPFFVVVSGESPFKTLGELLQHAKANPDRVSYGSLFVGSPQQLGAEMMGSLTNTKLFPVQFKEASQLNMAIVSKDIHFAPWTWGGVAGLIKTGRLRALAVMSNTRDPRAPDVPTSGEAGGPIGLEYSAWTGLMAPHGTPPAVLERISADLAKAMKMPSVVEKFSIMGVDPAPTTPSEMATLIRAEYERNGEIVKRVGIEPQ